MLSVRVKSCIHNHYNALKKINTILHKNVINITFKQIHSLGACC